MIFKHQKIILAFELAAVIAMAIYSGGHALNVPAQAAAETVVETETESVKKTAKESKEESETKKSKEKKTAKETRKKDEKPETKAESETVKKVAENKDNASSGNNTDNNSSAPAVGTSSEPSGNTSISTQPSGSNTPSPSGGTSTAPATPSSSTPQTQAPATTTPSPSTPQTQAPETTPAHKHNWVEKTRTVHHDATGHYEDVVVQEAWDEPVYEMVEKTYCSTCGLEIGGWAVQHLEETMHGGYWSTWEPVQTGSVHHDAVTESRWVEDTAAWDETVSDGYICSGCGTAK